MLLADGFSCVVFRQVEDDSDDYREVYRGVLCDTPDIGVSKKKDNRWTVVPSGGRVYKKQSEKVQQ
jgi:hypothetical protein